MHQQITDENEIFKKIEAPWISVVSRLRFGVIKSSDLNRKNHPSFLLYINKEIEAENCLHCKIYQIRDLDTLKTIPQNWLIDGYS